MAKTTAAASSPLDRARRKAYRRLLPLLFACYVIAYVDRVNVGFAKLNMQPDLAPIGFSEGVFGFGMGVFFIGYLLLEIPGTLLVEHWSARKWISRIMISWGFIAALTAFVHVRVPGITPAAGFVAKGMATLLLPLAALPQLGLAGWAQSSIDALQGSNGAFVAQFYSVRFLLGLAEAGFFPGVIVYLTHWFPRRDRTKALAWFFIGTPIAQMIGPPISELVMSIGQPHAPQWGGLSTGLGAIGTIAEQHLRYRLPVLGLVGWQWVFLFWGIPAVILGVVVFIYLTDRPRQAKWLADDEREALEAELAREKAEQKSQRGHMSIGQALSNPKVLLLAAAYFFVVTGNYGVEMYMASILQNWYQLEIKNVAYLIIIPPIGSLVGQILIGWNSDRTHERRWHASLPIFAGAAALALTPSSHGNLVVTVVLFTLAMAGLKAYLPAFWALPSLLMTESAAAASIGLINSFGNLGGWVGPSVVGGVKGYYDTAAKSLPTKMAQDAMRDSGYNIGLWFLAASMAVSALIILNLGIGQRLKAQPAPTPASFDPNAPPMPESSLIEPA